MENKGFEELLEKKELLLRSAAILSAELKGYIKSKDFENAVKNDLKKNEILSGLTVISLELDIAAKSKPPITEKARLLIKNINSSLKDLIKLEKENELLISQAGDALSGKYIESYKTYKQSK